MKELIGGQGTVPEPTCPEKLLQPLCVLWTPLPWGCISGWRAEGRAGAESAKGSLLAREDSLATLPKC